MWVQQFVIDGLGHLSALVSDQSRGVGAVVDPRRDVDIRFVMTLAGARFFLARAGRSNLGCLIMLLIASVVGYFGFNVGEAYLLVNNLAQAEAHVAALEKICLLPCEELDDLKKKVAEYRKKAGR